MISFSFLAMCAEEVYEELGLRDSGGVDWSRRPYFKVANFLDVLVRRKTMEPEMETIIAVCGTNEKSDWKRNLNILKRRTRCFGGKGKVHGGCEEGAMLIYPEVSAEVLGGVTHFAAHSQGAGIVQVLVALLYADPQIPNENIGRVCCLGGPRVANRAFRRLFKGLVPKDTYRFYTRRLDFITWLPPWNVHAGDTVSLPSKFDGKMDHRIKQYVEMVRKTYE